MKTRFSNLLYKQYNNSIKDFLAAFHQSFTVWLGDTNNINAFENWKNFILATYNAGENEMRKNPELFSLFADLLMQQSDVLPQEMFVPDSFLIAQLNYLIDDMTDTEIEELEQKAQTLTNYFKNKWMV